MLETRYCCDSFGLASTSTTITFTSPEEVSSYFARAISVERHGGHQVAPNLTRTGRISFSTIPWNSASVEGLILRPTLWLWLKYRKQPPIKIAPMIQLLYCSRVWMTFLTILAPTNCREERFQQLNTSTLCKPRQMADVRIRIKYGDIVQSQIETIEESARLRNTEAQRSSTAFRINSTTSERFLAPSLLKIDFFR